VKTQDLKSMAAKEVMDAALASEAGVKLLFSDHDDCRSLRFACYKLRAHERDVSKQVYPMSDTRYGTSIYDELTIKIRPANPGWYLILARLKIPEIQNL
jgi:hypothetical protein